MRRLAPQVLCSRLVAGLCLLSAFAAADGPVTVARGTASYYRPGYLGATASGEAYHPELFTAAHASLPMGTWVRVTNLKSGQSVLVRVNDRSPFVAGNLIDVSLAAAEKLGLIETGYAEVSLSLLESLAAAPGDTGPSGGKSAPRLTPVSGFAQAAADPAAKSAAAAARAVVRVQFATYHELSDANRDQADLRGLGVDTTIYRREGSLPGEPLFRLVTTGGFADPAAAGRWMDYIKRKSGRYPEACVSP